MQYKCKKSIPGLTIGRIYEEIFPYPNPFNACVWNDDNEPMHYPRKEFFEVIE